MKVLFKETNQAQVRLKLLVSTAKLIMLSKLVKRKRNFKDMVMS